MKLATIILWAVAAFAGHPEIPVHENEFYVQVAERRLAARPEVVEDAAILARKKAVAMAQGIVDLLEGGK